MSDTNAFGGGNRHSLYVPLSDVEQETISRLVESKDLRVHVIGWGVVNNPRVTFGDLRVSLAWRMDFDRPAPPGIEVPYFDLELRTGAGLLLFKDRKATEYLGRPITVSAGMFLDMVWDIALQNIDPKVVKAIKPGAVGLTSRLQDRDTGDITLEGNMRLTPKQKRLLRILRSGEALVRNMDKAKAEAAVAKGLRKVK